MTITLSEHYYDFIDNDFFALCDKIEYLFGDVHITLHESEDPFDGELVPSLIIETNQCISKTEDLINHINKSMYPFSKLWIDFEPKYCKNKQFKYQCNNTNCAMSILCKSSLITNNWISSQNSPPQDCK